MRQQPVNIIGGAYTDDALPWSCQDTVNLLPVAAEAAGTRTPTKLSTAPGLRPWVKIGDGADYAIRGMRDVEGKLFVVSGAMLYQISNTGIAIPRGGIPGVGRVSMAHNQITGGNELLVVNGDSGFVWNTVDETFTKITDEGYPGAFVADFIDGYLAQVEPFGRFWFHSDLASALDYNTIDRYEAESSPDRIVALLSDHLEVWVFGERTAEIFANTGAGTGTFQSKRISIEKGCAGQYTPAKLDNGVAWLGSDGVVYQAQGYNPVRISTRAIESAISGEDWSKAFAFTWADRGHEVYYLTFPSGQTFGYDASQRQWHRRASWHPVYDIARRWRVNAIARHNGQWIAGDYRSGELYVLDWDYPREGDTDPLVRERVGGVMHSHQNRVSIPFAEVIVEAGGKPVAAVEFPVQPQGPTLTGSAPDGVVGVPYAGFQYIATPGDAPITAVTKIDLVFPPGLSMDADGLLDTGTPTTLGTFPFTLRATDENELYDDHDDEITISSGWLLTVGNESGTIGSGQSIWQSANLTSWQGPYARTPSPINYPTFGPIPVADRGILVAGSGNVIDRSVDPDLTDGMAITSVTVGGAPAIRRVRPFGSIVVALNASTGSVDDNYWTSADKGATWTERASPDNGILDIARLDIGRWVAALSDGASSRFIYSDDAAEPVTWSNATGSGVQTGGSIACNGRAAAYLGTAGRIYVTTDGLTWTQKATLPGANQSGGRDATQFGDTLILAVEGAGGAGIARSEDDGETWDLVWNPLVQFQVERISYGEGVAVVSRPSTFSEAGEPRDCAVSYDQGATWAWLTGLPTGGDRKRICYREPME